MTISSKTFDFVAHIRKSKHWWKSELLTIRLNPFEEEPHAQKSGAKKREVLFQISIFKKIRELLLLMKSKNQVSTATPVAKTGIFIFSFAIISDDVYHNSAYAYFATGKDWDLH